MSIFSRGWLLLLWLTPMSVFPQGADAQKKVRELLASFSRREHRVVERRGVRAEMYLEIRSEPDVKGDVRDYSGRYVIADRGYSIEIKVGGDAVVEGAGREPSRSGDNQGRRFTLKNGKMEGPLLTADKVYGDGASARFEGVFMKLTTSDAPGAEGVSAFGLGALGEPAAAGGVTLNRLFYRRQG